MLHPRPTEYEATDLKHFYESKKNPIDLGLKQTLKLKKKEDPNY